MPEILDSGLHLIDRCISAQICLDRGRRNWFSFCLDGLRFLKHAAFEEGIANQRGLRLLWSNSKGFPHLTTTAECLRQCQNTKTSVTSNISPQPFQSTLLTRLSHCNAFNSGSCYCNFQKTKAWDQCTGGWQHWLPTWADERSVTIHPSFLSQKIKRLQQTQNWGVLWRVPACAFVMCTFSPYSTSLTGRMAHISLSEKRSRCSQHEHLHEAPSLKVCPPAKRRRKFVKGLGVQETMRWEASKRTAEKPRPRNAHERRARRASRKRSRVLYLAINTRNLVGSRRTHPCRQAAVILVVTVPLLEARARAVVFLLHEPVVDPLPRQTGIDYETVAWNKEAHY